MSQAKLSAFQAEKLLTAKYMKKSREGRERKPKAGRMMKQGR